MAFCSKKTPKTTIIYLSISPGSLTRYQMTIEMNRGLPLIHPGELLKEEVIEAHELSITDAAKLLHVTRSALSNVLNGKAAISPEMALKISAVFGGSAEFWIRQQANFDLEKASKKIEKLKLKRFAAA